jgi:hypothetical protein
MIEAITLGSDYTTSAAGLYDLLTSIAVPDYFTSVVNDGGTIKCYVDNVLFLAIRSTVSPLQFTITSKWGFTRTFSGSTNRYLQTAYTCGHGISLCCDNNLAPFLTICKDANGNTTLIYTESATIASVGYTNNLFSLNINSTTPTIANAYQTVTTPGRGDFIKTVLSPILVNGNDGDYTDNTKLIVTAQFTMSGNYLRTWVIDGHDYWSNGLWVVLDE